MWVEDEALTSVLFNGSSVAGDLNAALERK